MNILFFSSIKIYPINAGSSIRIYNMAKYLQNLGHSIHFVYYADNGIDKVHCQYMQDTWDTFTVIEKTKSIQRRTGNYELDEWYEETIQKKVNELIPLLQIDVVWTNYIFYSQFLDFLPNHVFKIIDTHDKFSDRYKLFLDKKDITYTWFSYSIENEALSLDRADLIIAITEEEEKYFSDITNTVTKVIGHLEVEHNLEKEYNSFHKIGFIGGDNHINVVAINDFLEYYFSKAQNIVQIIIAGNVCNSINIKNKNISLMGKIDSVDEFYGKVDLIINPLFFGTGQKIKSVEALSYGVPIISTPVGFEGINSSSDYHNIETLEKMVDIIHSIVQTPRELKTLSDISKEVFTSYKRETEKNISHLFVSERIKLQSRKDDDKKALSSIILKYRQDMQKKFDNLIIQNQKEKIERLETIVKRNNAITDELETILQSLRELSEQRALYHPIKKIKIYKKLMKSYYKIK